MDARIDRPTSKGHDTMKRLTGHLYFWVLIAIIAGGLIGYFDPQTGASLKPLGDGFIALVKMLIGPVISAPWSSALPDRAT